MNKMKKKIILYWYTLQTHRRVYFELALVCVFVSLEGIASSNLNGIGDHKNATTPLGIEYN